MRTNKTQEDLSWIEKRLKQIGKAPEDFRAASSDYLHWMAASGYSNTTQSSYKHELEVFARFVRQRRFSLDQIFTIDTLKAFREMRGTTYVSAVRGLSRYMFEHGRLKRPIGNEPAQLPQEYEDYYYTYTRSGR